MRSGYLSETAMPAGQGICSLTAPSWQLTGGFSCFPSHRAADFCRSRRPERAWRHQPAGW